MGSDIQLGQVFCLSTLPRQTFGIDFRAHPPRDGLAVASGAVLLVTP
jgi:hypothetical protein